MSSEIHLGSWLSIGSPVIAELAADAGFHWLLIDLEHGCTSEAAVPDQLRAFRGSAAKPIVRVPAPDADRIARVLDWGAHGIMVPHVNSAAEATACVRAMRYPPLGHRGVSRSVRAYGYGTKPFPGETAPVLLAQIETWEGVSNVEAIAAVDGVDVLFVGPADLQFDLKSRPQATLDYASCLKRVVAAAVDAGKECGILCRDAADLETLINAGFRWVAVDSDLSLLRAGYQRWIRQAAEIAGRRDPL